MFGLSKLYTALIGGAAALTLILSGWIYVRHLQHKADQAQAAKVTAKALDQLAITTHQTQEKADDAVKSIQAAPGAETPLPPDIVAAHKRGIERMRDGKRPR